MTPSDNTPARGVQDRASAVATAIIQVIFESPRDLRVQIESLLRNEFHDIARMTRDETRPDQGE